MVRILAILAVLFGLWSRFIDASVSSQEVCFTKLGKTSVKPVPSNTYALTLTLTATQKVTSTPVKTITPPAVTSTATTTSISTTTTVAPASTKLVTTTSSSYVTVVLTETVTATETDTTTTTITTTTTTTIPTPAGFTPVSQEPGYVPKIKGRDPGRIEARATQNAILSINKAAKTVECAPKLYPTSVVCAKLVETITTKTATSTASKTSTTTLPPATSTTTSTVKSTTTVTSIPPDVTSTITTSTTVTVLSTTTTTTTTTTTATATQTVTVPGGTFYAACDPSNIVSSANGGNEIYEISINQPLTFASSQEVSAYDCCVRCQTTANCVGIGFYGNFCQAVIATTCQPGAFNGAMFYTDQTPGTDGFAVSNGPCGAIANGGTNV